MYSKECKSDNQLSRFQYIQIYWTHLLCKCFHSSWCNSNCDTLVSIKCEHQLLFKIIVQILLWQKNTRYAHHIEFPVRWSQVCVSTHGLTNDCKPLRNQCAVNWWQSSEHCRNRKKCKDPGCTQTWTVWHSLLLSPICTPLMKLWQVFAFSSVH